MRVGFLGVGLAGKSTTIRALARVRGAAAIGNPVQVDRFELRTAGSPLYEWKTRAELISWADAIVVTLDVQPERLEKNREVVTQFRSSLIGKPRVYQINKVDVLAADWLLPHLPELGWEPRMDVVRTSMVNAHDRNAPPIGLDALWEAIERLDPT